MWQLKPVVGQNRYPHGFTKELTAANHAFVKYKRFEESKPDDLLSKQAHMLGNIKHVSNNQFVYHFAFKADHFLAHWLFFDRFQEVNMVSDDGVFSSLLWPS